MSSSLPPSPRQCLHTLLAPLLPGPRQLLHSHLPPPLGAEGGPALFPSRPPHGRGGGPALCAVSLLVAVHLHSHVPSGLLQLHAGSCALHHWWVGLVGGGWGLLPSDTIQYATRKPFPPPHALRHRQPVL